ncbi:hypothetical protein, partial [Stenotrophomonas maltophilia]|uniref:hypothetical protein n=1 Tax=Stenotrophomonas maltophilia TaxID=40324 RepID=UPI001C655646
MQLPIESISCKRNVGAGASTGQSTHHRTTDLHQGPELLGADLALVGGEVIRDRLLGLLRTSSTHRAVQRIRTTQCGHRCTGHAVQQRAAIAAVGPERLAFFLRCV